MTLLIKPNDLVEIKITHNFFWENSTLLGPLYHGEIVMPYTTNEVNFLESYFFKINFWVTLTSRRSIDFIGKIIKGKILRRPSVLLCCHIVEECWTVKVKKGSSILWHA